MWGCNLFSVVIGLSGWLAYHNFGSDTVNWMVFFNASFLVSVLLSSIGGITNSKREAVSWFFLFMAIGSVLFLLIEFSYINSAMSEYSIGIRNRVFSNKLLLFFIIGLTLISHRKWVGFLKKQSLVL